MTETSDSALRPSVLDRLIQLDESGGLSIDAVRSAAQQLGVSEPQLQQWLTARRTQHISVAQSAVPEPATRKMGYREAEVQAGIAEVAMTVGDDMLPRIPDSDVPTFRADAYRGLTSAEFARVDAVYAEGIEATCRWFITRTGRPCRHHPDLGTPPVPLTQHGGTATGYPWDQRGPRAHPGFPEARNTGERREILGLYRFLGELVCDSPGRGHTIARLRGAQAGFLLHGMRLDLPADLNYSVGPGLTTAHIDSGTVEWIRAHTSNPADAAAVATVLCTGATTVELGSVPCTALTQDALVFTGPIGYGQAADVYVWVVPPPVLALLHDARAYQEARAYPAPKLFAGAIGGAGRRLRRSAAGCGVTVPDLHHWHHSWIRRTGLLRGADQPEHVRNTDLLFALRLCSDPGPARGR
ncbi:hypothetical protein [Nocardia jinanensis]|uniref:hypothetical protein n=1 Tax=Nocardia jinanensis TaxID=382504 RepID=UPI000A7503BF|nr:hypothetical protein [Nocardia jinanensis]